MPIETSEHSAVLPIHAVRRIMYTHHPRERAKACTEWALPGTGLCEKNLDMQGILVVEFLRQPPSPIQTPRIDVRVNVPSQSEWGVLESYPEVHSGIEAVFE
jgi:hypothetical protein